MTKNKIFIIVVLFLAALLLIALLLSNPNTESGANNNANTKATTDALTDENTDGAVSATDSTIDSTIETTEPTEAETTVPTEETIEETTVETTTSEEGDEDNNDNSEIVMHFTERDVIALAKVLYNECRGVPSDMHKACVAWTACNRVDAEYGGVETVYEALVAEGQFAYNSNTPVTDELYALALDVLTRWNNEKNGETNVGRVLPSDYMWFSSNKPKNENDFRNSYSGEYDIWDYSYENPYES